MIDDYGIDSLEYNKRWSLYRIRLGKGDVAKRSDDLRELMKLAYEYRAG